MKKIAEIIYRDFNQIFNAAPTDRDKLESIKERETRFISKLNENLMMDYVFLQKAKIEYKQIREIALCEYLVFYLQELYGIGNNEKMD